MAYPQKFQDLFEQLSIIIDTDGKKTCKDSKDNKNIKDNKDIKDIKDIKETLIEVDECMICGDELINGSLETIQVSCSHKYHYDCIYNWWCKIKNGKINLGKYTQRECPYCRTPCDLLPTIDGKDKTININCSKQVKFKKIKTNTCSACTNKGTQCTFSKKYGNYCGKHAPK